MRDFSRLKKALEEAPAIFTQHSRRYFSVLIPLVEMNGELHLLFQKRAADIPQGGEISFPGGEIEKGENETEAALRETEEELGVSPNKIEVLGTIGTHVNGSRALITGIVGYMQEMPELKLSPDEVESVFTVPLSYFIENPPEEYFVTVTSSGFEKDGQVVSAEDLNLPDRYKGDWGKSKYAVYFYQGTPELIWGITARFVLELVGRITPPTR